MPNVMQIDLTDDNVNAYKAKYKRACARKWRTFTFNGSKIKTEGAGKYVMYMEVALKNFKDFKGQGRVL